MILAGAVILGAIIGLLAPITISAGYLDWLVVAVFCVMDAFLTELNLFLHKKHGTNVLMRILFNAVFGGSILILGRHLGYDLYIIAVIPFAIRTLNNINHLKELLTETINEGEIIPFRDRRAAIRTKE